MTWQCELMSKWGDHVIRLLRTFTAVCKWPFWVSAQIQLNFSLLFVNEITREFLHEITWK